MANQLLRFGSLLTKTQRHLCRQSIYSSRALSSVSHSKALNIPQTNQTELKNGIRVTTEDIGSPTATVGVWLETGSRYETERTNGLSNLVVRALLAEPTLESQLQRLGAVLNARVGRDQTYLAVRCLSADVDKAVQILGRLVSAPKVGDREVESARQSVLREMQEMDTNYESVVMNGLHSMAFQSTSLALPPVGSTEGVSAVQTNHVLDYVNTHFKGPRIVVAAAGDVDHNEVVQSVSEHFGQINTVYDKSEVPLLTRCRYTGSDLRIRDDSMPVAHIALAVEGAGYDNPDHIPLMLAASLMGCWDRSFGGGTDCSSYLGLCSATDNLTHSFRSFNLSYKETGLFGIYLVTERMKQEDAIWHLTYEWKRFCTELTDNELNRAKNSVLTALMRQNEGSANIAANIGSQVVNYGRRIPLDEWQSKILAVSAAKVREVCNDYIWDRCPVVSAIGPVEQLEDYEVLRGKFYWVRY